MVSGRGALRDCTATEVSVREKVWLHRAQWITHPSNHSEMFGGVYVTDQAMKSSVTLGRPFRHKSGEVTHCAEEIKPA